MKNIETILSEYGITIPEDKKVDFNKAVIENYKTIAEHGNLKTKVETIELAKSEIEKQLISANETIKGYQGLNIEEIQKSAKEWEQKYKDDTQTLNQKLADVTRSAAIKSNLLKHNPFDVDVAFQLLDISKISMDESGQITGLDEQVSNLKAEKAFIWKTEKFETGYTPPAGATPTIAKDAFDKMSYPERVDLKQKSPELFKKLTEQKE